MLSLQPWLRNRGRRRTKNWWRHRLHLLPPELWVFLKAPWAGPQGHYQAQTQVRKYAPNAGAAPLHKQRRCSRGWRGLGEPVPAPANSDSTCSILPQHLSLAVLSRRLKTSACWVKPWGRYRSPSLPLSLRITPRLARPLRQALPPGLPRRTIRKLGEYSVKLQSLE